MQSNIVIFPAGLGSTGQQKKAVALDYKYNHTEVVSRPSDLLPESKIFAVEIEARTSNSEPQKLTATSQEI